MTFSEEAAELHSLAAGALRLRLTDAAFERILQDVTGQVQATSASVTEQLGEIRRRIHLAAGSTPSDRLAEQRHPDLDRVG